MLNVLNECSKGTWSRSSSPCWSASKSPRICKDWPTKQAASTEPNWQVPHSIIDYSLTGSFRHFISISFHYVNDMQIGRRRFGDGRRRYWRPHRRAGRSERFRTGNGYDERDVDAQAVTAAVLRFEPVVGAGYRRLFRRLLRRRCP